MSISCKSPRPFCVKGRKISSFLIQTDKVTYPMEDTKYLETLPLYKESYMQIQKLYNNQFKLLKFIFINDENF